jgi:hypothetical protein
MHGAHTDVESEESLQKEKKVTKRGFSESHIHTSTSGE